MQKEVFQLFGAPIMTRVPRAPHSAIKSDIMSWQHILRFRIGPRIKTDRQWIVGYRYRINARTIVGATLQMHVVMTVTKNAHVPFTRVRCVVRAPRHRASISQRNRLHKIKTEMLNRGQIAALDLAVTVPSTFTAFVCDRRVRLRVPTVSDFAVRHLLISIKISLNKYLLTIFNKCDPLFAAEFRSRRDSFFGVDAILANCDGSRVRRCRTNPRTIIRARSAIFLIQRVYAPTHFFAKNLGCPASKRRQTDTPRVFIVIF
jgi:hypothetical protein